MSSEILEGLYKAVLDLDADSAERLAKESIEKGIDPLQSADALTKGVREVGERFGRGEMFIPELVLSATVLKRALPFIHAEIKKHGQEVDIKGRIVIGTIFGDLHSIGKDMVATLLVSSGYEVQDLGVNVRTDAFLKAAKEYEPNVLAMSALLTTTAHEQKNVISYLTENNIRNKIKIIVGGAPITQEFADSIGADGYSSTAPGAVKLVDSLLGLN